MSDIRQLFNNPKKRTRDTDESVAMSSFADELSAQTSRASEPSVTSHDMSSSFALVDDELPDDIIELELNAGNLDESQVGNRKCVIMI